MENDDDGFFLNRSCSGFGILEARGEVAQNAIIGAIAGRNETDFDLSHLVAWQGEP